MLIESLRIRTKEHYLPPPHAPPTRIWYYTSKLNLNSSMNANKIEIISHIIDLFFEAQKIKQNKPISETEWALLLSE